MGLQETFSNMLSVNTQNSQYCMSPMSHSPNLMGLSPHWGLPGSTFSPLPISHPFPYQHLNHLLSSHLMHGNSGMAHPHGLTGQNLLGISQMQQHLQSMRGSNNVNSVSSSTNTDHREGSAFSLSSASSSLSSPTVSPRNVSPVNSTETNAHMDFGMIDKSVLSDLSVTDRRAPGCEKKSLEMAAQKNFTSFDYEQKKLMAMKALQSKPNPTDFRVPTSAWSGYGLSQTMPAAYSETAAESEKVIFTYKPYNYYKYFLFI